MPPAPRGLAWRGPWPADGSWDGGGLPLRQCRQPARHPRTHDTIDTRNGAFNKTTLGWQRPLRGAPPQVPSPASQLTKVLAGLRHTFVVADATLPDMPLVYASEG